MIIEKRSYFGYNFGSCTTDSKYKNNIVPFLDFLASLCEWDSVGTRGLTQTFKWGNVTVTAGVIENAENSYNNIGLKITINGVTYTANATTASQYLNIVAIKTATSVGIIVDKGAQNAAITADYSNSSPLKFVLTETINLNTGETEKGVVLARGTGTAGEQVINMASASSGATASTVSIYPNAAVTILHPAAVANYPGYSPHVLIPLYQTCASSSSKATVGGAAYYIMAGTLYLLDD
jgi:hypothetical protein